MARRKESGIALLSASRCCTRCLSQLGAGVVGTLRGAAGFRTAGLDTAGAGASTAAAAAETQAAGSAERAGGWPAAARGWGRRGLGAGTASFFRGALGRLREWPKQRG